MIKLLPLAFILALSACGMDRGDNNNDGGIVTPPVDPVDPPDYPKEGKRLSTKCDGYTVVREYADGKGGSYFEREENFERCGYVPLSVEVVKRQGDFFKPVIIEVTGTDEWDFEVEAGHATRTDVGIEITSDGQLGTFNALIAGEQYEYELIEAPLCLNTLADNPKYKVTCDGYLIGRSSAAMIYYGDEDTDIVQIEVGIVRPITYCTVGDCSVGADIDPAQLDQLSGGSQTILVTVQKWLDDLNAFNVRTGVYIEFVSSEIVWGNNWNDGVYGFTPPRSTVENSDVVLGWGNSGGNGGEAFMPRSIWPGMSTPRAVTVFIGGNLNNQGTSTHEIGHAMGLGHGVWGIPDWQGPEIDPLGWQGGSIYPRFGHGWMGKKGESVCGTHGSVMSYSDGYAWTNSLVTCEELGAPEFARDNVWNGVSGSRTQSDEAYHLNRVRYSYSLIHNEHRNVELAPEPVANVTEENDEGIYIAD